MAKAKDILEELEGNFTAGTSFIERKRKLIKWSPAIDTSIGGGVPEGSTVVLTGPPKVGKTVAALSLAAEAQKIGKMVFYLNIEGRIKTRDLKGISGLDLSPEKFQIIESKKGSILLAEQWLELAEKLMHKYPGCVIIIDSFSMLCTEAEATAGMDEMQRATEAKLMYKFFRKVAGVVPVHDIIIIGIAHIIANPSGMGAGNQEKSGNAAKYAVDVKLEGKWAEKWTIGADENSQQIGQLIHWDVKCSAINGPGSKPLSYLRYGIGFDKIMEIINLACDCGIIDAKGAWYTLSSIKDQPKFQGKEKLRQGFLDNPDWETTIGKELYQLLGISYEQTDI